MWTQTSNTLPRNLKLMVNPSQLFGRTTSSLSHAYPYRPLAKQTLPPTSQSRHLQFSTFSKREQEIKKLKEECSLLENKLLALSTLIKRIHPTPNSDVSNITKEALELAKDYIATEVLAKYQKIADFETHLEHPN